MRESILTDKATFSIILPIRNEYERLKRCLPSLLIQTLSEFEIVIVDSPKTSEQTQNYIAGLQDSRIRYVLANEEMRVAEKRNLGADIAVGEYFYFIDADMEFPPDTLSSLLEEIKLLNVKVIFVRECTPGNQWIARMKNLEKEIIQDEVSLIAARVYKKFLFYDLGKFNGNIGLAEEDLSDRALFYGAEYTISKTCVNHYEISHSLAGHLFKKFNYGLSLESYFRAQRTVITKHDKKIQARTGASRLVYFKSRKTWENPLLGIQFICFKAIEIFFLILGLLTFQLLRLKAC